VFVTNRDAAVDRMGCVYVLDASNQKIRVAVSAGKVLHVVGGRGAARRGAFADHDGRGAGRHHAAPTSGPWTAQSTTLYGDKAYHKAEDKQA